MVAGYKGFWMASAIAARGGRVVDG